MLKTLRKCDYLYRVYIFRILLIVSILAAPVISGLFTERTVQPFEELNPLYITQYVLSARTSPDNIYKIYYWRKSQTKIALTVVTIDHYVHFYLSCELLPDGRMRCYADSMVEGMYSRGQYKPVIFWYDFARADKMPYNARCQWKRADCTSFVIQ